MKELYMKAHEELVAEMLEQFPYMTEDEAFALTADAAWDRVNNRLANAADQIRQERKDRGV